MQYKQFIDLLVMSMFNRVRSTVIGITYKCFVVQGDDKTDERRQCCSVIDGTHIDIGFREVSKKI